METLLLVGALALVAIWTAQVARSKGRNPWLWGGASFVLGIPWMHLIAVLPLVILIFMKSPQQRSRHVTPPTICPKCEEICPASSLYCTNCGWELSVPVESDPVVKPEPTVSTPVNEEPDPVLASPSVEASPADEPAPVAMETPAAGPAPDVVTEDAETEPPPVTAPAYRKVVPVDAPTAAGMTERGVRLFNQGRIQESIDQFTKAIALDANYIQAWAKRAEAYAMLGRGDQAAEDRRRLEALDAGSWSV
jgi:hypothetical protein